MAALGALLAVTAILMLVFGQRLAKDYAGAAALVPYLTIDGFAFDVELLYVARRTGFRIREVGIVCHCRHDSRVRVKAGIMSFVDVLRVRLKTRRPNPVVREAASSSTSHR